MALITSSAAVDGSLSEDASNLGELHRDWQDLVRRRAVRSILSIPVRGSNGVTGCLTLGCLDPLIWEEQWWYGGMQLLSGWATTVLSQHQPTGCIDFFEQLLQAEDLSALAAAFVHCLPASLHGEDLGGKVEARLALVSSRLTRALVYASEPGSIYNSSQELQRLMLTEAEGSSYSSRLAQMDSSALPPGHDKLPPLIQIRDSSYEEGDPDAPSSSEHGGEHQTEEKDSVAAAVQRLRRGMGSRAIIQKPPGAPTDFSIPRSAASCSAASLAGSSGAGTSDDDPPLRPAAGRAMSRSISTGQSASAARAAAAAAAVIRRGSRRTTLITAAGASAAGLMHIGDGPMDSDRPSHESSSMVSSHSSGHIQGLWSAQRRKLRVPNCINIPTDGTLLMSALEAGDVMTVKDSLVYLGRKRVVGGAEGGGGSCVGSRGRGVWSAVCYCALTVLHWCSIV